jgi:hypothetical protein
VVHPKGASQEDFVGLPHGVRCLLRLEVRRVAR